MIYEIKVYGDEVLRKKSVDVEKITAEILEILKNMVETMHSVKGIGLAAPQVGFNMRMFVLDIGDGKVRKVINPKIEYFGDLVECEEGCLSVPGIYKPVKRYEKVKITYLNEKGETVIEEGSDLLGRAFQHEYDHLDGILYVDKVSPVAKRLISKKLKFLEKNR